MIACYITANLPADMVGVAIASTNPFCIVTLNPFRDDDGKKEINWECENYSDLEEFKKELWDCVEGRWVFGPMRRISLKEVLEIYEIDTLPNSLWVDNYATDEFYWTNLTPEILAALYKREEEAESHINRHQVDQVK